jgi:hypothetical protein
MPTLDQQLDEFEKHGPFTFERAFALVKLCAKSRDTDFHDVITNILHKFPPEELEKIFRFLEKETGPDAKIWDKGCSYGGKQFHNYNGKFSAEQLKVIANVENLELETNMDFSNFDVEDKLAVLMVENRHLQKRQSKKRDGSPSRKRQ